MPSIQRRRFAPNVPRASRPPVPDWQNASTKAGGTPAVRILHSAFFVVLLACGAVRGGDAEALIDTNFGAADKYAILPDTEKNERLSGALPAGWQDNSSWAKVWASYQRLEEPDRAFLRVNVAKQEAGNCQLVFPLPKPGGETFFRFSFNARSRTATRARLGIRQNGPPYRFLWDCSPGLKSAWQDWAFEFRLDGQAEPVGFYIIISGAGEVDLARLSLLRVPREQLLAELRTQQAGAPKNLLRISRLPLGLQSGWSLSRECSDGDDVEVLGDDGVVGPSSAPALRISPAAPSLLKRPLDFSLSLLQDETASRPFQLYSAPFAVPLALETHTASLYVKGEGKGNLSVLCDERVLARRPFECPASGDWHRVSVPFKPVLLARACVLLLEGKGKLWIDALQVERGGEATEYAAPARCEVALA
ncbi:MAG: hypothetical protein ABSE73_16290, partial [Planctomycetota bacterium]